MEFKKNKILNKIKFSKKLYRTILSLVCILVIVGLYPGMGGEGAQRDINQWKQKRDQSGFIVSLFYDGWPSFSDNWLFSFSLFQILVFGVGIKFINDSLSRTQMRWSLLLISSIGFIFMFQVVRDATLLALCTLGLGLTLRSKKSIHRLNKILFFFGIVILITGALFKPVMAPIVALIFYLFCRNKNVFRISKLCAIFISLIILVSPFLIDKKVTSELEMKRTFAEQQLFIFDAAKMYCWGHNSKSTQIAKELLKPFLSVDSDYESLCASLEPMGWDDLRRSLPSVDKSPAITWYSKGDSSVLQGLVSGWVKLIRTSPFEWLQIKAIDASQVLFMANGIYFEPLLINTKGSSPSSIGDLVLEVLFTPAKLLDRLRIFSVSFSLIFGLILIYLNGRMYPYRRKFDLVILNFLLINISTWILLTLLYIANPGRYSLPFVLLSYVYLIVAVDSIYNKSHDMQT
jgi:hypothetical protein